MSRSLVLSAVAAVLGLLLAAPALASGFPVTVAGAGGSVTVTEKPRRIVSLSPTSTETLFAIGAGPQVIAVDDQSDYPRAAPRTKLSGFTPNVEAIAGFRPDLVVVAFDSKGLVAALRKLRIPVVLHEPAKTLQEAYRQMRQLGRLTGNGERADALVRRLQKRIAQIVGPAAKRAAGLTLYHELSPDFYSATSSTFIGRVYRLFGLENIADAADSSGSGFPQLSAEYIVATSPDLIVLADTVCCAQTPASVRERPGWSGIAAVRTGSIVRIDDSIASRWGPRIVNFVRAVAIALKRLEP